jgi:hypothetical protein
MRTAHAGVAMNPQAFGRGACATHAAGELGDGVAKG